MIINVLIVFHVVVSGVLLAIISNWYGWNEFFGKVTLLLLCPIACGRLIAAGEIFKMKFINGDNLSILEKSNNIIPTLRAILIDFLWGLAHGQLILSTYDIVNSLPIDVMVLSVLRSCVVVYGSCVTLIILSVAILDVQYGNVFVQWMKLQRVERRRGES